MDWKGFVLDNMGYFSIYDIPRLIFFILVSAVLTFVSGQVGMRVGRSRSKELAVWASIAALGVGLVKGQLVFAVVLLGIFLLVKVSETKDMPRYGVLLALVIGMGCGSGAALITAIALVPIIPILRWAEMATQK